MAIQIMKAMTVVLISSCVVTLGAIVIDLTTLDVTGGMLVIIGFLGIIAGPLLNDL
jgi:hypothetical protein